MNYNGERFVAGGGTLSLATIGTVAGGAALVNNLLNGNGLFGGGNNSKYQEVLAENATLKSEKYSDTNDAKIYDAIRILERNQAATNTEVICLQKELAAYVSGQKDVQELRQKLTDCEINGVKKDLNCLAGTVENMAVTFNGKIASINAIIGGFTQTVIKESAICDTSACGGGTQ